MAPPVSCPQKARLTPSPYQPPTRPPTEPYACSPSLALPVAPPSCSAGQGGAVKLWGSHICTPNACNNERWLTENVLITHKLIILAHAL